VHNLEIHSNDALLLRGLPKITIIVYDDCCFPSPPEKIVLEMDPLQTVADFRHEISNRRKYSHRFQIRHGQQLISVDQQTLEEICNSTKAVFRINRAPVERFLQHK